MTKNFHSKNFASKGFTMAELMITLAIIGILSAIAVPAYMHQVRQSHQNEARGNLTALDAAMKSFWAEYASYTGDLDVIGWKPTGSLSYNYGWLGPVPAPPGNALNIPPGDTCYTTTGGGCLATWTAGFTNLTSATSAGAFGSGAGDLNTANSFPGGAVWHAYGRGALSSNSQNDEWTIDNTDTLINTLNGI